MTAVEMLELLASLVLPGRGLENNGFDLNYQPFDEKTAEHPFWINPEQIEIARKQGFYYDLELYPDNREACFNFYTVPEITKVTATGTSVPKLYTTSGYITAF